MKRWIVVQKDTGEPRGLRISYPTEGLCRTYCDDGEVPQEVDTAGASGPFSDFVSGTCILEARDASLAGGPWTEQATGAGTTRFPNRWEAEEARQGLIALCEGWTADNTRVRPYDAATDGRTA